MIEDRFIASCDNVTHPSAEPKPPPPFLSGKKTKREKKIRKEKKGWRAGDRDKINYIIFTIFLYCAETSSGLLAPGRVFFSKKLLLTRRKPTLYIVSLNHWPFRPLRFEHAS